MADAGSISQIRRRSRKDAGALDVSAGAFAGGGAMGIYVHFPFCSVLCPYCDFAVDTRADIPHDAYADAVIRELERRAPWFRASEGGAGASLVSIYFGGGTPGLWRADALARVIEAGRRLFLEANPSDGDNIEITVEANPGEIDDSRLQQWRQAGVNRLSLGIQALDDRLLSAIGRNHDASAAARAMTAARAAGFDNISIDLMFGLPEQSFDDWQRTIDQALALRPDHVSAYALTIERGTAFGARSRAGTLVVPDGDASAEMQIRVRDALAGDGFQQYEVSSHARPGRRSVHNSLYWTGAPYLGVGASAASCRPLVDGGAWRFTNARATATYLRAVADDEAPTSIERRNAVDWENEMIWLGLRTTDGLNRAQHVARFGRDPLAHAARQSAALDCQKRGWLVIDPVVVRPTPEGLLFADEIAARLWV